MASADPAASLPRRVAVTGASGLIGSALVRRLRSEGSEVVRLVRRPPRGADEVEWDPAAGRIDAGALEGVDGVVHLAGENVGTRWTEAKKRAIRESRVSSTSLLARALAGFGRKPRVMVSASAVGIYGERGDEVLTEASLPGLGFLAGVVREWEAAAAPAAEAGIRVVHPRLGVVLSAAGGALAKLLPPFRLGGGGVVGSGRQWMSWLSRQDAVEILVFALREEGLSGPVNAVAGTSTNQELTKTLAGVLNRPAFVPLPAFALKLALGEMADETLLASQRAEPRVLAERGFRFRHPTLEDTLRAGIEDKEV